MRRRRQYWLVVVGMTVAAIQVSAAETLTYVDLVNRLTDLEQLAVLPTPGEKCAQSSSYDRASRYDEAKAAYVDWGANGDGSGFIREENGMQVLAEMEGPGVIWRIWSALAEDGLVRIYLDGAAEPAVDLPFIGYFDHKNEPFTPRSLVYLAAGGRNCFIPIPYRKSCKIVAEPGWGRYFQFTYTTFPKDTVVPTFSRKLSPEEQAAIDRVAGFLAECGTDPAGRRTNEATEQKTVTVAPGQTISLVDLKGPRAITAIRVKMDLPATPADHDVLRELALRITWDDEAQPSVWSPLGDFFGTAPGYAEYRSLPLGMTSDGCYCYWYMPFADRALMELTNDGEQPRKLEVAVTHAPLSHPIGQLGRFHARWHRDADLPPERPIDWTILKTNGRGRFCGVMLHIWNPKGGWWGEGDEKFFVEGERFPSTFGTGTEDYFGYAWCSHNLFNRPFHNQTVSVPANPCGHPTPEESGGHTCNNRFQIADNVPFHSSFEGALEKYYPNDRPTRYACVAYWYQTEPHRPWAALLPVEQRRDDQARREMAMLQFLRDTQTYKGDTPIEALRDRYEQLLADTSLPIDPVRLKLRMARAEKVAGHEDRARSLAGPEMEALARPFAPREYAEELDALLPGSAPTAGTIRPTLVENDDGSVQRVKRQDRWCVVTQRDQKKPYIYFSLPRECDLRRKDQAVRMTVTYFVGPESRGSFRIHYDSHYSNDISGAYRETEEVVPAPGAGGFCTAVLECPRARLDRRQNARADFRIAALGEGDVCIADIVIEPSK